MQGTIWQFAWKMFAEKLGNVKTVGKRYSGRFLGAEVMWNCGLCYEILRLNLEEIYAFEQFWKRRRFLLDVIFNGISVASKRFLKF